MWQGRWKGYSWSTSIIERLIGTGESHVLDGDHVETIAGPDFQCRGYVKVLGDDLAEDLAKGLAEGFGEGVASTLAVGTIAGVIVILTQIDGGDDTGGDETGGDDGFSDDSAADSGVSSEEQ